MKMLSFAGRTAREILRDPLNLFFGLGFPVILLLLLSAIQAKIPVPLFEIESLTPGILVFGLSFMTLFAATLVAKDRESAFLQRLYTTPLRAVDFICGYILPLLPIALLQGAVCCAAAFCLGLAVSVRVLYVLLLLLPTALVFISLGVLCGSVLTVKQVGGICGALLTNLTAWLSGAWFDLSLVGGAFERIATLLPFAHAVEMERAVLAGNAAGIFPHLWWVLGYMVAATLGAVLLFLRQMRHIK
jgi:ABC-2 type transport system permease protein